MYFYRISGLSVASEIILPGVVAGAPERAPEVTIRRASVPKFLSDPRLSGPAWQIAGRQFLLRISNVARFLLTAGQDIAFEAEPGGDLNDLPIYILGPAFGILLHQREQIVLHASGVNVGGQAILFCGPSGAGKSTMAAALAQHSYPLVSEDVCAITVTDAGVPMVHPDGRQLKLWTQAIAKLDLNENRGARVQNHEEKFYVKPRKVCTEPLPLGPIYVLREALPPNVPGIIRVNAVDVAFILRQNAFRPNVVSRLGQSANYFHAAATIADRSAVFLLTRTFDFMAMPQVILGLEQHWLDIGLLEKVA